MKTAAYIPEHIPRVLIVDDDPGNRDLLEAMLASEGYDLTSASGGEEALALIAEAPPDIVLLDIMMPGMNGYEVIARLKGDVTTSSIPIIVVTALDDRDARIRGLETGAEDFLTRPVDHAELRVRVRNLLRLKAYADYYANYNELLEREVISRTAELLERSLTLEQSATALRENEAGTNYALGAANMGIWTLDLASEKVAWSETMGPVFGLNAGQGPTTAEELLALVHKDDRRKLEQSLSELATDGVDHDDEFRVVWPGGGIHWVAGQGRMIRDALDRPSRLLGIAANISDRKSLEAQFRQAQKMEAVGLLAGGIAHDFNNLLTAILGYSNFVMDALDRDDSRRLDMEEVVRAGQRAAELTRQLLAFSRKQILQPTTVGLNAMVTGMQQMLARLIGENVELVPLLADDLHMITADMGQLEQVLMNLVVNARDAMPEGGRLVVETANVELDQSFMKDVMIRAGSYVMLAVSDNGIGMTEGTRQRLFEPFFTTKETGKGTGLGLATVYGIIRQSGGYIWVFSEPGKGATFKIYLPRAIRDDVRETAAVTTHQATGGSESILLVEDDAAVRFLTRRILEGAGYRVFDCASPQQAKELFEKDIDLVSILVTDVIMPGFSGPRLFETLASSRPTLRVLYLSGYTGDTILQQGELEPGFSFLQKPFTADELKRRVRALLDE
jgi:two-component system, cell cycle sensor histidine kinase and response regulator CckA